MLIDGAQLDAPAAPLDDLLRVGLEAGADEIAILSPVTTATPRARSITRWR